VACFMGFCSPLRFGEGLGVRLSFDAKNDL
jgi:hypothetical protein